MMKGTCSSPTTRTKAGLSIAQALIALAQAARSLALLSVMGVLLVMAASLTTRSLIGNVKKAGVVGGVGSETCLTPEIVSWSSTIVLTVISVGFTSADGVVGGVEVEGAGVTGSIEGKGVEGDGCVSVEGVVGDTEGVSVGGVVGESVSDGVAGVVVGVTGSASVEGTGVGI